jgi:hypothetical protein
LIYAIGGWVDTSTPFAKIGLFIGEYPDNEVGFGETCDPPGSENCYGNSTIGTASRFFGVIDPAGFERFEYREMEGKLEIDGADIKYIFSDDFYFVLDDPGLVFKDGFEKLSVHRWNIDYRSLPHPPLHQYRRLPSKCRFLQVQ